MQSLVILAPALLGLAMLTACGEPQAIPEVDAIEVTAPKTDFVVGETARFTAVAKSRSGEVLRDRPIVWTSEHPTVATINEQGWVDTKAPGFARIVATSEYRRTQMDLRIINRNPAPIIRAIEPSVVNATDRPPFVLTIFGDGFTRMSRVRVGPHLRQTGFVSRTELNVEITSTEIEGGSPDIRVETPEPGGGISESRVLVSVQPAPVISGVSPASITAGGPRLRNVTISGAGFTRATRLYVNGQLRHSVARDFTSLTFDLFEGELTAPGVIPLRVVNPAPGGGTATTTFTVTPSP